ncbi:MAG: hypothetical protein AAF703_10515 [Cyanobacteria bacterium P01_D01_bin.105]
MDVLLLFIYVIVVFLVLYQMSLELEDKLEDKVEIVLEENTLAEQTQGQIDLQNNPRHIAARSRNMSFGKKKKVKRPVLVLVFDADKEVPIDPVAKEMQKALKMSDEMFQEYLHPKVIIRIAPTNEQPLKEIPFISVIVTNGTADMQVYVDWDSSSIEMMNQGNRVVRATPNIPIDLSQPQVPTVINPDMTVTSNITVEKRFSRSSETSLLFAPSQPVLNLKEKAALSKLTDPTKAKDNIQSLYALDLKVLIKHRTAGSHEVMNLLVPFIFKMKIKVDEPAFPPMRWWLRHFGKNRPKKGNWFWGSRPPEPKGD